MAEPVLKASEAKKAAFLVMITPGDTERMDAMFLYAITAAQLDYQVMVFLALDSPLVVKKQVFAKLEPKLQSKISEAIKLGVVMNVCSASAHKVSLKQEDLLEGVGIVGMATFFYFAEGAAMTLTWS